MSIASLIDRTVRCVVCDARRGACADFVACRAELDRRKKAEQEAYQAVFLCELERLEKETGRKFYDDVALLRHVRRLLRKARKDRGT